MESIIGIASILIPLKLEELIKVLNNAITGTANVLVEHSIVKPCLSMSEAYSTYGRSNVERWLSECVIKISNKKNDRERLEAIAASSNRRIYLPVADRC